MTIRDYYNKRYTFNLTSIEIVFDDEDKVSTDQSLMDSVFFIDPQTNTIVDALSRLLASNNPQEQDMLQRYLGSSGFSPTKSAPDDVLLDALVPRTIQRASEVETWFKPIRDTVNSEYARLRQSQTNAKDRERNKSELNNINQNVNNINNVGE